MGKLTITTTQKIRIRNHTPPRIFTWLVALGGIPFTGGASLLMLPITELGFRAERRAAAAEAADKTIGVLPKVQGSLEEQLRDGNRSGAVRVETWNDRVGPVDFVYRCKVRKS